MFDGQCCQAVVDVLNVGIQEGHVHLDVGVSLDLMRESSRIQRYSRDRLREQIVETALCYDQLQRVPSQLLRHVKVDVQKRGVGCGALVAGRKFQTVVIVQSFD